MADDELPPGILARLRLIPDADDAPPPNADQSGAAAADAARVAGVLEQPDDDA